MYCRHCGSATTEGARFCIGCGQQNELAPLSGNEAGCSERASREQATAESNPRPWLVPAIIVTSVVSIVLTAAIGAGVLLYPRVIGNGGFFGTASIDSDLANLPAGSLVVEIDVVQLSKAVASWAEGSPDAKERYSKAFEHVRRQMLQYDVDLNDVDRVCISMWNPGDSEGPNIEFVAYLVGRFGTSRYAWTHDATATPLDIHDEIRIVALPSRQAAGSSGAGAVLSPNALYIGSSADIVRRALDARAKRSMSAYAEDTGKAFRESQSGAQALRLFVLLSPKLREEIEKDPLLTKQLQNVRSIGAAVDVSSGCQLECEVRTVSKSAAQVAPASLADLIDNRLEPEFRSSALWRALADSSSVQIEGDIVRLNVNKSHTEVASLVAGLFSHTRTDSDGSAAIATLRSIASAEATFSANNGGRFATLDELISAGHIDASLRQGFVRSGYRFSLSLPNPKEFDLKAEPEDPTSHQNAYNITSDFIIRYRKGAKAPEGVSGQPLG